MENEEFMIDVEVEVHKMVDVSIHVADVIHALNHLELPQKWNRVATILNAIELDAEGLEEHHKELINNWLNKQILKFKQ